VGFFAGDNDEPGEDGEEYEGELCPFPAFADSHKRADYRTVKISIGYLKKWYFQESLPE
jgi:hypothetical protein